MRYLSRNWRSRKETLTNRDIYILTFISPSQTVGQAFQRRHRRFFSKSDSIQNIPLTSSRLRSGLFCGNMCPTPHPPHPSPTIHLPLLPSNYVVENICPLISYIFFRNWSPLSSYSLRFVWQDRKKNRCYVEHVRYSLDRIMAPFFSFFFFFYHILHKFVLSYVHNAFR